MSPRILKPPACRLEVVNQAGAAGPDRVLIGPVTASGEQLALLVAYPGEPGESCMPVRLSVHGEVPENLIIAHTGLLERLGFSAQSKSGWELRFATFETIDAERVLLELMVNESLERSADRLSKDISLDGMLLYLPAGQAPSSLSIEAGGEPTRIKELLPRAKNDAVYRITAEGTAATLFAPAQRVGVDAVILADCSGSMSIEDMAISEEVPGPTTSLWSSVFGGRPRLRTQSRSDALVQALLDLLDRRLLAAGTVSRIALVAFGNISQLRFPRAVERRGMIEIDETTPEDIRAQFRQAIKDLIPERTWGTDIGQALQFAASHISNFGRPGNERLIVLISDGAHWQAKGEEGSGDLLENVLAEPVSLMETLNTRMSIHLHAIGISNPEIYERWVRSDPAKSPQKYLVTGSIPNHRLLEELVRVGGGDPARTGDAYVLEDYLRRLGEGVTRRVVLERSNRGKTVLSDEEKHLIDKLRSAPSQPSLAASPDLATLRDKIEEHYHLCNRFARGFSQGHSLFNAAPETCSSLFRYMMPLPVRNEQEFGAFQLRVYQVFDEGLPSEIRMPSKRVPWPEPFPAIKSYLHSGNFRRLGPLRHAVAHAVDKPKDLAEGAESMRFFIGVPVVGPNDVTRWSELQKRIMEFLLRTLHEIEAILQQAVDEEANKSKTSIPPETLIQW